MTFYENRLLADDSYEILTIRMKYHTLFFLKIGKDFAKIVVCCNRDWRLGDIAFKTYCIAY